MIRYLLFASMVTLAACKGHQQVVNPPVPDPESSKPEWVRSRPVSSSYYIGIGLASKARSDFQETAKKNALNDLASEISVVVEGNSLLQTLDRRTSFDETFSSTIRTSTREQIEGFELVGTWENGTEYYTYYRLSKAEHARIKAERKARSIASALDLHGRSKAALASGDLRSAFDNDLRALIAMKEYWGENDVVDLEGRQVPLVNELYNDLQKLSSGVQLAILPERCELNYGNHFRRELLVSAQYRNGNGLRDLVQLPLVIEYPGSTGKVTEMKSTDAEGRLRTTVQRIDPRANGQEVVVRLDVVGLASKELEPALVKALLASLTVPEKRAAIALQMPKVFMRSNETNLGQPVGDAGVATAIREEMTRNGFRFVDRESDSDMQLTLTSSTRQGGESNGFFTAFLDVTFSFRDRKSGDVVHEGGKQAIKGVQLAYDKAGMDAYKKAVQEVRKDLVPAVMNALQ
ncbi:MAG: LPP20 family lipoprotein [Flavobacteriales bacterium]|nr:LPP20 family lipoprotein [Flavobacteriales bacterium]